MSLPSTLEQLQEVVDQMVKVRVYSAIKTLSETYTNRTLSDYFVQLATARHKTLMKIVKDPHANRMSLLEFLDHVEDDFPLKSNMSVDWILEHKGSVADFVLVAIPEKVKRDQELIQSNMTRSTFSGVHNCRTASGKLATSRLRTTLPTTFVRMPSQNFHSS